jgi:hypothetical protein
LAAPNQIEISGDFAIAADSLQPAGEPALSIRQSVGRVFAGIRNRMTKLWSLRVISRRDFDNC